MSYGILTGQSSGVQSVEGIFPDLDGNVELSQWFLEKFYPVGSIYASSENTSPAARWGGTWEQIKGRVLVGAGSPEPNTSNTFGALSGQSWSIAAKEKGGQDYHALTSDENGKHYHGFAYRGSTKTGTKFIATGYESANVYNEWDTDSSFILESGGGKPHNNMMPYYGCYMWVRLA